MFPKNARVAQETKWTKCCPAHKCNSSSFVAIWFCVSPSELWCCHICTCPTWIWIVHRCCDLVYTFVLINWHICSSLYKCKWLVGFYLLLPCTLNWNFALGEIYQFQPFQIEVALPFFLNNHLIKNYFLIRNRSSEYNKYFFQCYAIIIVMLEMFLWPEELFVFIAVIGLWRDKAEVEEDGDRGAFIIQAFVFLASGWFQIKNNYFLKLFSSLEVDRGGAEQTEPKSLWI